MSETSRQPPLTDPFRIADVEIPNRVLLAPLAGIGNWFVRLQAKRHGAGLAVSEMVSSFGLHHRNERTLRELMRIHPDEHPVSVQLFGHDAGVMRSGAAIAAEAGADLIDINMGCPVARCAEPAPAPSSCATPSWRWRLRPRRAEGSGLPVTVKLRSGIEAGDRSGFDLALRLADEAGVAAIAFHPRAATIGHRGKPDYQLTRELAERRRGAGDRLRRPDERRGGSARLRGVRCRRGDDRPRRAGQSLGVRGTDRPPLGAARPRGGRRRAALGDRSRRGAPRGASGRSATCASSTPGICGALDAPAELAEELQRSADLRGRGRLSPTSPSQCDRPRRQKLPGCPRYNPATSCPGAAMRNPPHPGFLGLGAISRLPRKQKRG